MELECHESSSRELEFAFSVSISFLTAVLVYLQRYCLYFCFENLNAFHLPISAQITTRHVRISCFQQTAHPRLISLASWPVRFHDTNLACCHGLTECHGFSITHEFHGQQVHIAPQRWHSFAYTETMIHQGSTVHRHSSRNGRGQPCRTHYL